MTDPSQIREGMPVMSSDGERLGTVDKIEGGDRVKLNRRDAPDGEHHFVPLSAVSRVDEHVHLAQPASAVRSMAGWTAAAAGAGAATAGMASATTSTETTGHGASHIRIQKDQDKGGMSWLPWLLGALALLALLIFGIRGCDDQDQTVVRTTERTTSAAGTAQTTTVRDGETGQVLARETVLLPNQQQVQLAPGSMNYELNRYLAGTDATPRTFAFDRVHFPTASAVVVPAEREDVANLARILQAYPNARVRITGYTDARGDAAANAQLGAERARAIQALLTQQGVTADRIETATGGETNPNDTNATKGGQAENRRTELAVLSR